MSATITIEEAQAHLAELIDKLTPGEEIVITRNGQPIARIVGESPRLRKPRQPGSAKDKIRYMTDDFDAPLRILRSTWNETLAGRPEGFCWEEGAIRKSSTQPQT